MTSQFMAMVPQNTRLQSYASTAFSFGNDDFTIIFMPRATTFGTVLSYQGTAENDGYRIELNSSGAVVFSVWIGGVVTVISTVPSVVQLDGTCHCIAIQRGAGNLSIFVDFEATPLTTGGTSVSLSGSIGTNEAAPLTLGGEEGTSGTFSGGMMNAGVWTRALTLVELQQAGFAVLSPLAAGMAGYWTLDQTTHDASPNQNPLRIVGTITYKQCMDCVWLHGDNDYRFLQMQTTPYLPPGTAAEDGVSYDSSPMLAESRPLHVPAGAPMLAVSLMQDPIGGTITGVNDAHITVTDPDGVVYDTTTNTDTIFVHVVNNVPTAIMVMTPKAGSWRVNATCSASVPLFLQAQVIPSSEVVATATNTLSPIFDPADGRTMLAALGGFWSVVGKIAVAAVVGVAVTGAIIVSGGTATPAVVAGLVAFAGVGMIEAEASLPTIGPALPDAEIQVGGLAGFIVANANLQIIDANCDGDPATQRIYKQRLRKLYPAVDASPFLNRQNRLIGDQDTRVNVTNATTNLGNGYVTASGHGQGSYLMGWFVNGNTGPMQEVIASRWLTPVQAQGKIFHFFACRTGVANGLGQALVTAGAVAFFGYNVPVIINVPETPKFCAPDIEIDKKLIIGSTCTQAYDASIALYQANVNRLRANGNMAAAAQLEGNMNALVAPSTSAVYGDATAHLDASVN